MGWTVEFAGREARSTRTVEIVRGVYFQDGQTTLYRNPEKGSYGHNPVLAESFASSEALMVAGREADPPLVMDVDEWHYQLLDSDGNVVGHGDHYVSEEHVVAALTSLLEDRDVPFAAGKPGRVAPEDAELGKASATGSPHCTSCGHKITVSAGRTAKGVEKRRAARDAEVLGDCPACGSSLETVEGAS